MRPLDIAGMGNVIADLGQQLEIAVQENKQLKDELEKLRPGGVKSVPLGVAVEENTGSEEPD